MYKRDWGLKIRIDLFASSTLCYISIKKLMTVTRNCNKKKKFIFYKLTSFELKTKQIADN